MVNSTVVSIVPTREPPAVAELADAVIPSVDKSPAPLRQATDHPAGLNAARSPALIRAWAVRWSRRGRALSFDKTDRRDLSFIGSMIKEEHLERQDAPTILSVVAVSPCSRQLDVNAAGPLRATW